MRKTSDYPKTMPVFCNHAFCENYPVDTREVVNFFDGLVFDKERALYGIRNAMVARCLFAGPADGESALKESENIHVFDCDFRLRYPLWHAENARIENSRMTEDCRAALWYGRQLSLDSCRIMGIKAIRECNGVELTNCTVKSSEFGWLSRGMVVTNTELESEYPFFHSSDLLVDDFKLKGKYSFQYLENATLSNCRLNTKDAFWHSRDVTISDSVISGEYLGWYSKNLKLVRCRIIGTQPLCYATGLVLEDCEMIDCDLAFERSDVHAEIRGDIASVKNPDSGHICADSIGEVITNNGKSTENPCVVNVREQLNQSA